MRYGIRQVSNIVNFYKGFFDRSGCQAQLLKDVLIVVIVREHCKKLRFLSSVSCACMGGCVGGCAKPPPATTVERSSRRHPSRRGVSGLFLLKKDWWSSSPEHMENNVSNSHSMRRNPSVGSTSQAEETQLTNDSTNSTTFVNHALIMWNERRREWLGNRSQNQPQMPREPIISWNTTYDDLLATNQPFPQPVPLPEMIDFLVDVWHEEGLYE
jgi:hypothetical protein